MPQFLVPVISAIASAAGVTLSVAAAGYIAAGAPVIGSLVIKKGDAS